MSPQISSEEWHNDEQLVYLTYREMSILIILANEALATGAEESPEAAEILKAIKAKIFVELKPVLYDSDIEKLGGE